MTAVPGGRPGGVRKVEVVESPGHHAIMRGCEHQGDGGGRGHASGRKILANEKTVHVGRSSGFPPAERDGAGDGNRTRVASLEVESSYQRMSCKDR
jgi:hypothetical protein